MHTEAYDFVRSCLFRLNITGRILDIGSYDVNGGARNLFGNASEYLGIDLRPGPGVDLVADGATFEDPKGEGFDAVVCTEALEHTPRPRLILANALRLLKPGGALVVTCAGPARAPHSGVDGGPLREGEHYANVRADDLLVWCDGFLHAVATYSRQEQDVYLFAKKARPDDNPPVDRKE